MRFTDILTSSAHAFIVEGKNGEARGRFINDFIKGLNCECENISERPCNKCSSCRQIDAGTGMDVIRMSKSGKTAYKVEDAVAMVERIGMGAYGRHIIGVIDEADLLSETIQNKLLKTLEEPERDAVIILATTNRDNLLRTVRSRCSILRVADYISESVSDEEVEVGEDISAVAELFIRRVRRSAGEKIADKGKFFESRTAIEKKIKSQEDAVEVLGVIEDMCRDYMTGRMGLTLDGNVLAGTIEKIEMTGMDIYKGMKYSNALKRLFLELA